MREAPSKTRNWIVCSTTVLKSDALAATATERAMLRSVKWRPGRGPPRQRHIRRDLMAGKQSAPLASTIRPCSLASGSDQSASAGFSEQRLLRSRQRRGSADVRLVGSPITSLLHGISCLIQACRPAHAADAPVLRGQGGVSGCADVFPDGGFL